MRVRRVLHHARGVAAATPLPDRGLLGILGGLAALGAGLGTSASGGFGALLLALACAPAASFARLGSTSPASAARTLPLPLSRREQALGEALSRGAFAALGAVPVVVGSAALAFGLAEPGLAGLALAGAAGALALLPGFYLGGLRFPPAWGVAAGVGVAALLLAAGLAGGGTVALVALPVAGLVGAVVLRPPAAPADERGLPLGLPALPAALRARAFRPPVAQLRRDAAAGSLAILAFGGAILAAMFHIPPSEPEGAFERRRALLVHLVFPLVPLFALLAVRAFGAVRTLPLARSEVRRVEAETAAAWAALAAALAAALGSPGLAAAVLALAAAPVAAALEDASYGLVPAAFLLASAPVLLGDVVPGARGAGAGVSAAFAALLGLRALARRARSAAPVARPPVPAPEASAAEAPAARRAGARESD